MAEINITGMEEVQKMLAKLTGPQLDGAMRKATKKIGLQAQNKMQEAPGPSSQPVQWASRKQQQWYFATRREAGLPLEYTRESDPMSQRLLRSWTGKQLGEASYVVGTRVTYAPYVQSDEFQSPQHKATGWKTDKQAVEEIERSGVIKRVVEAEINSLLRSL